MRVARRVKSLSLETRQKPPNSRVCSKSIASMMSALSLAFLPTVLRNCWTGWIACSSSTARQLCRFDVVKSPYTRLTLEEPSEATSEGLSPITAAEALSASMRTARRRVSSGILCSPPPSLTAYIALRPSSNNRSRRLAKKLYGFSDRLVARPPAMVAADIGARRVRADRDTRHPVRPCRDRRERCGRANRSQRPRDPDKFTGTGHRSDAG